MGALLGVEVLARVTETTARHRRRVSVQERQQPCAIVLARFAQHASGHRLDHLVLVLDQDLGEPERVVQIVLADEVQGAEQASS